MNVDKIINETREYDVELDEERKIREMCALKGYDKRITEKAATLFSIVAKYVHRKKPTIAAICEALSDRWGNISRHCIKTEVFCNTFEVLFPGEKPQISSRGGVMSYEPKYTYGYGVDLRLVKELESKVFELQQELEHVLRENEELKEKV